jgi:tryptophanyl-tRNA synthetase
MRLKDAIEDYFAAARDKRAYYLEHPDEVDAILATGAAKARARARGT